MDAAIKVENLSKRYQIGKQLKKNLNFQKQLTDLVAGPFGRLKKAIKGEHLSDTEDFWALKDISLVNPVKSNKFNVLIKTRPQSQDAAPITRNKIKNLYDLNFVEKSLQPTTP